jgi:hypothetical protein
MLAGFQHRQGGRDCPNVPHETHPLPQSGRSAHGSVIGCRLAPASTVKARAAPKPPKAVAAHNEPANASAPRRVTVLRILLASSDF